MSDPAAGKSEDENVEESEGEQAEDESADEENQYSSDENISDQSSDGSIDDYDEDDYDYDEEDLPEINFPKFVIPRTPASAFPTYILKKMKENAAPRTALKLMQICKYFCHEEFPWLPMEYIRYQVDYGFSYMTLQGQEVEYTGPNLLKLFKKKLWMIDEIDIDYSISINFILRHIAVCDLLELCIEDQKLLMGQFKFLTDGGKIEKFSLRRVSLNYENGVAVPLEEILKCIPNVEEFAFGRSSIHHENFSNFIQFLNPENLNFFALGSLTDNFDFETFINFITKYPKIQYSLQFKSGIPDKCFKKLETFVENIRKAGSYSRYVFSRIYCKNQTWRYGSDEWYQLPDVFCKCGRRQTLHSNYDPPYFCCDCNQYLMLASTEAWNEQFHGYYE